MRSSRLNLERYDTDKISSNYLRYYDEIFSSLVDQRITLLEIGVLNGASLSLWCDYFPLGRIAGIDIRLPQNFTTGERIQMFEGSQTDLAFLSTVAGQVAPDGFDVIIDDASHIGELTRTTFYHLFERHLKPGGYYVIEDWGTGYWQDWPDGKGIKIHRGLISSVWSRLVQRFNFLSKVPLKLPLSSHQYGMVGFVKSLIDEVGIQDASRRRLTGNSASSSKIRRMVIFPSVVFVQKA
jgi:hypothetical protein